MPGFRAFGSDLIVCIRRSSKPIQQSVAGALDKGSYVIMALDTTQLKSLLDPLANGHGIRIDDYDRGSTFTIREHRPQNR